MDRYTIEDTVSAAAVLFAQRDGLVPVVTQSSQTRLVLMVAFANRQALEQTIRSGYAHYYSRTRQEIWEKGATSGNRQRIHDILIDCDADTILYIVEQEGAGACHTGAYSCFYRRLQSGNIPAQE